MKMNIVELKLTSELFEKLLNGTKRTTIRKRGKIKMGDEEPLEIIVIGRKKDN